MKHIISLFLLLVLAFSVCGCGGTSETPVNTKPEEPAKPEIGYVGQEVVFGSYYKSEGGNKEPMQWIVLDIQDNKALMIAKYAVDAKRNEDVKDISGYLNLLAHDMLSDAQRELVVNQTINGEGCYMFLLDSGEVEKYIPDASSVLRVAQATSYAVSRGAKTYTNSLLSGCCNWCLRDGCWVGGQAGNAGEIKGLTDVKYGYGIRPAIWVTVE